jgi:regulator of sirC expression with transglutaminase-like and TPR domain
LGLSGSSRADVKIWDPPNANGRIVMGGSPRERLGAMARQSTIELPLAEGALLIAAEEYQDLDIARYLGVLDALADDARGALRPGDDPPRRAAALCDFLYSERGFRGNRDDYSDPRNSFLNEVLERRLGIPISLAVVYLEVGWRLRLPVFGVGMPAHFLAGCETAGEPLFVDPFHGTVLTEDGCERLFRQTVGDAAPFRRAYLVPTPARDILVRMLRNLKGIFLQHDDIDRAAGTIERILLLAPDRPEDVRDLGLVRFRQGRLAEARDLLAQYLRSVPLNAADRDVIEDCLARIRAFLGSLN